jgi:hypothetical protein
LAQKLYNLIYGGDIVLREVPSLSRVIVEIDRLWGDHIASRGIIAHNMEQHMAALKKEWVSKNIHIFYGEFLAEW